MPDDNDTNPMIERELQQARQTLDDATVINRLYYAAFHALQAALYNRSRMLM